MDLSKRKAQILQEMRLFLLIAPFLAFLFCSFVAYRRMILQLPLFDSLAYGYALIEAAILAKIILIGRILGIGERFTQTCLAVIVLYKALTFALFSLAFVFVETLIRGLFAGHAFKDIYAQLLASHLHQFGAHFIITFAIFVPFFSFLELGHNMGEEKLFDLFFKKNSNRHTT